MKTSLAALTVLWMAGSASALPPLGAAAITANPAAAGAQSTPADEAKSPRQFWREQVHEFARVNANLPPDEAAQRWLSLFDARLALPRATDFRSEYDPGAPFSEDDRHRTDTSAYALFAALPPPAAWDALAKAIAARPAPPMPTVAETSLRMISAMLTGQHQALAPALEELHGIFQARPSGQAEYRLKELRRWIATLDRESTDPLVTFEEKVAATEKGERLGGVEFPDLDSFGARERAVALLTRVLQAGKVQIRMAGRESDRLLAAELATRFAPGARRPQWMLVRGLTATDAALFEAIDRDTPNRKKVDGDDDSRDPAERWYVCGLVAAGRTDDAARYIANLKRPVPERWDNDGNESADAVRAAGAIDKVRDFYRDVLRRDPELPFWRDYLRLASIGGDPKAMETFAREMLARPELSAETRQTISALVKESSAQAQSFDSLVQQQRKATAPPPWVWKAKPPETKGELQEAEKAARTALAADPSFGWRYPEALQDAYDLLGAILEKEGSREEAEQMAHSAEAAGLRARAWKLSREGRQAEANQCEAEALARFPDVAWVQQSWVAMEERHGAQEKADAHYRNALELMLSPYVPSSSSDEQLMADPFFQGAHRQRIADVTLAELARKWTRNPRVYLLLGRLRAREGKFVEAAAQYRAALKLDPDFLEAWLWLGHLDASLGLTSSEKEAVALACLRLDPLGNRGGFPGSASAYWPGAYPAISNLRALWPLLEQRAAAENAGRHEFPHTPGQELAAHAFFVSMMRILDFQSGQ